MFDSHVAARQRDGTAIKDAIYRLQDEPSEPQTYRALMSIEHFRDALSVLTTIARDSPNRLAEAFGDVDYHLRVMVQDRAHDYADRLRAIVADAERRSATLVRIGTADTRLM